MKLLKALLCLLSVIELSAAELRDIRIESQKNNTVFVYWYLYTTDDFNMLACDLSMDGGKEWKDAGAYAVFNYQRGPIAAGTNYLVWYPDWEHVKPSSCLIRLYLEKSVTVTNVFALTNIQTLVYTTTNVLDVTNVYTVTNTVAVTNTVTVTNNVEPVIIPEDTRPIPEGTMRVPGGKVIVNLCQAPSEVTYAGLIYPLYPACVFDIIRTSVEIRPADVLDISNWAIDRGYNFDTDYTRASDTPWHKQYIDPARDIDWIAIWALCNARSEKEGLMPFYRNSAGRIVGKQISNMSTRDRVCDWTSNGYRLPTLAEITLCRQNKQGMGLSMLCNDLTHSGLDMPSLNYAKKGRTIMNPKGGDSLDLLLIYSDVIGYANSSSVHDTIDIYMVLNNPDIPRE